MVLPAHLKMKSTESKRINIRDVKGFRNCKEKILRKIYSVIYLRSSIYFLHRFLLINHICRLSATY